MTLIQKADSIQYDLSNVTVLLAEDSLPMQTLIASMLRSFGVGEVLVCGGAYEAISLLTITQAKKKDESVKGVDIVLTDWLMPDGSGVELLDWIREHADNSVRFLPVIMMSAYTTEKVIAAARDHGANEALVKPVSGGKLARRILSVIDHPRPFIKCIAYFGPDRRRQLLPYAESNRRRIRAEQIRVRRE